MCKSELSTRADEHQDTAQSADSHDVQGGDALTSGPVAELIDDKSAPADLSRPRRPTVCLLRTRRMMGTFGAGSVASWRQHPGPDGPDRPSEGDETEPARRPGNANEGGAPAIPGSPAAWPLGRPRPIGCDLSRAVGCGILVDLAEEGAELTDVGAVAKDLLGNIAQTEARLFL
jgi:hypothetical protein